MKRYLIKGALALLAGLFITSCSHETEVDFVPIQDQRTQEFDKAFKEAFTSNIAPNQDWGFSTANYLSSRAGTRGTRGEVVKPDMTNYPSSIAPGRLEPGEAEYVTNWFATNPGFSHETLTWTNYFVQHVSYKTTEQGIWHRHDQNHNPQDWDEPLPEGDTYFTLDQLRVGTEQTHVLDYNATKCANGEIEDTRYIKNSNTNDFSVRVSWENFESHNYKLAKITYNGKTNYYVGFTAWAEKDNNGTQEFGANRKYYCDDWIIKIVPGEGQTTPEGPDTPGTEVTPPASETEHYTAKHRTTKTEYFKKRILLDYGRVFCEDLGGNYNSNRKDFDYNDVVFDAYLYKEVEYKRETVYDTYEVTVKWKGHLPKMVNGNYVYDDKGQMVYDENETEIEVSKYTSEPEYVSGPIESPVEGADNRATFKADICLIACGATKPIKVGASNDVNEVHKAFGGYSVDCMINTFDENTEKGGGFGYHVVAEPVGPEDYSGVFRLVDITSEVTNKKDPSIADIPVYVQWDGISATKVVAPTGAVPQKFMSRDKDNWTSERCFLGDAYPSFTNWVSRPDYKFSTGADGGYLYSGYPSPNAGLPFSESLRNQTENLEVTSTTYPFEERSDLVRVVYTDVMPDDFNFSTSDPTPSSGTVVWTWTGDVWTDNANGEWMTIYSGNGDKFDNTTAGDMLKITGYQIANTGWWQFNLANTAYNGVSDYIKHEHASGETISETIVLDDTKIENLKKGGLISYMTNVHITKVELIKR